MKKIICFVLTLLVLPVLTILTGCSLSMNLIIDTEYAKTEYVIGETFSSDGLIVKAQSSNGEVEVDDYKVDYSAFDNSEVGTYLIKVTYEDRTATYSVKVREDNLAVGSLGDITLLVNTQDAKTEYFIGEDFSAENLIVEAEKNSNRETVTEYTVDYSNFNKNTAGVYLIEVQYTNVIVGYYVKVKNVEGVELNIVNTKTTYYVGEAFTSEGLIVNKVINDDPTAVADFSVDSSDFDSLEAGTYTIVVNYNGVKLNYNVVVKIRPILEIDTALVPRTFIVGQDFDANGLVAFYEVDGERYQVSDFQIDSSDFDSEQVGICEIKVTYKGLEQSYQVEVVTLEALLSKCEENIEQIKAIEQVFLNNFAIYNQDVNYSKLSINEKWTTESWAYETGVSNYYVSYEDDGIQAEYYQGTKVFQSLEFLLSSISDSIAIIPESVESVEAYYNDLYLNIKLNFGDNIESIIVIKDNNIVSIENYTFGMSYGKSIFYTDELDVPEQPKGLTIKEVPEITIGGIKDIYAVGEQLNNDNIKVFADGELASDYEYSISVEFDSSVVGQNLIEVNYKGISYEYFDVEVAQPELVIDTTNAKTEFLVGEDLSLDGVVVKYKLGESETIVEDVYYNTKAYDSGEAGEYEIKLMYNGIVGLYTVEVIELSEMMASAVDNGSKVKGIKTYEVVDRPMYCNESVTYYVLETDNFITQIWCTSSEARYVVDYVDSQHGIEYLEEAQMGGFTPASQGVEFVLGQFYSAITPIDVRCSSEGNLTIVKYTISGSEYYDGYLVTMKIDSKRNLSYFKVEMAGMGEMVFEFSLEEFDIPELPTGVTWEPIEYDYVDVDESSKLTYSIGEDFDLGNISVFVSAREYGSEKVAAESWEVAVLSSDFDSTKAGEYHVELTYKGVCSCIVTVLVESSIADVDSIVSEMLANGGNIKGAVQTGMGISDTPTYATEEFAYTVYETENFTTQQWITSESAKYKVVYTDTSKGVEYIEQADRGGTTPASQVVSFIISEFYTNVTPTNLSCGVQEGLTVITYTISGSDYYNDYQITMKADANNNMLYFEARAGEMGAMVLELSLEEMEVPEIPEGVDWTPYDSEVFADVDYENSTMTYIVGGEFDISNIQFVLLKSGEEENEVVEIARQWEVGLLNDGGLNTDVIGQYHITLSYKGVENFVVPIDVVDANFSNETIANIQANFADIKSGRGTSANPGEGDYLISQEMMYNETTTEEYTKKTWLYSGGAKYVIEYVDTGVPTEYLIKEGAGGFMTPAQTSAFMFDFAVNSVDRQNEVVSVVDGVVIVTYSFDNSADAERVEEICYNVTIKFDCNYHLQQIIIIVTSGGQSTEMNYEFSVDASEYEVPELPTGVTWIPETNE